MNAQSSHILLLIGRVLLAAVFAKALISIFSGELPIDYATFNAKFVPIPQLFVWLGFIFQTVAGICVLIGFKTRTAAYVLIVFTLITAFNFHDVGSDVFMRELSMIGGLLLLSVIGPGRWSLDKE